MSYKLFVVTESSQSNIDFDEMKDAEIAFDKLKNEAKVTKLYDVKAEKKLNRKSFVTLNLNTNEGDFIVRAEKIKKKKAIEELKLGEGGNLFPIGFIDSQEHHLTYEGGEFSLITHAMQLDYEESSGLIYYTYEDCSWDGKETIEKDYIPNYIDYIYLNTIKILEKKDIDTRTRWWDDLPTVQFGKSED